VLGDLHRTAVNTEKADQAGRKKFGRVAGWFDNCAGATSQTASQRYVSVIVNESATTSAVRALGRRFDAGDFAAGRTNKLHGGVKNIDRAGVDIRFWDVNVFSNLRFTEICLEPFKKRGASLWHSQITFWGWVLFEEIFEAEEICGQGAPL